MRHARRAEQEGTKRPGIGTWISYEDHIMLNPPSSWCQLGDRLYLYTAETGWSCCAKSPTASQSAMLSPSRCSIVQQAEAATHSRLMRRTGRSRCGPAQHMVQTLTTPREDAYLEPMVEVRLEAHQEIPLFLHSGTLHISRLQRCQRLVGRLRERLRVQHKRGACDDKSRERLPQRQHSSIIHRRNHSP